MHNRVLHFTTNRAGGFVSSYFPTSSTFRPCDETYSTRVVRALLGLDRTDDDYSVRAILGAVHGTPAVFDEFRDELQTYRIGDFSADSARVENATLISDEKGLAAFTPVAGSLPPPTRLSLSYSSEKSALLQFGEMNESVAVRSPADENQIFVTWPENLGVSGGLQLDAPWAPGSTVVIRGTPRSFPWDIAVERIRTSTGGQDLLQSAGLLKFFTQSNFAVEKIALVALALAKQHPDFDE